jgi:hypothetical protein
MSRGPGVTQRFILDELNGLEQGKWLSVRELVERYAEHQNISPTHSVYCSVRNACSRLTNPANPRIELQLVNKHPRVRLTELERLRRNNPWEIKRREMSLTWQAILADQSRELRKAKRK